MVGNHDPQAEIYQAIGEMVVKWNACEGRLRDIVVWLAGGKSAATYALTAHMTAKALTDAVPAMAVSCPADVREHLAHYAKGVDVLREYRNYYAHGIGSVTNSLFFPHTGGFLTHVTGKQKVKIHHDIVSLEALASVISKLNDYDLYGFRVIQHVDPDYERNFLSARPLPAPWPNKPPLPAALRKPAPILLGVEPQLERSEK